MVLIDLCKSLNQVVLKDLCNSLNWVLTQLWVENPLIKVGPNSLVSLWQGRPLIGWIIVYGQNFVAIIGIYLITIVVKICGCHSHPSFTFTLEGLWVTKSLCYVSYHLLSCIWLWCLDRSYSSYDWMQDGYMVNALE